MHRIDGTNHVNNLFANADPGQGRLTGTQVTKDWLNDVQENIIAFIESVGTPFSKGESTDLSVAIDAAIRKQLVGSVMFHTAITAQPGFLKANGAAISRTTYNYLYDFANSEGLIGTLFGIGDGSTTFQLPDFRGETFRSFDDGRGIDSGRALHSLQLDALQNITGSFIPYGGGNYAPTGVFSGVSVGTNRINSPTTGGDVRLDFDASTVVRTAAETRSRNIALNCFIRY